MTQDWSLLQEVSVEDVQSGSIDVHEDADLLLNLGVDHSSARKTNELLKSLAQINLSASDLDVFRLDSPELGRLSTGSGDVYKRATDLCS